MADIQPTMVLSGDKAVTQLYQVTIDEDEQISKVNAMLAEGWRLISIGYHSRATVYVLGRTEEKPRHRPGFVSAD